VSHIKLSWDQYNDLARNLIKHINETNFRPELIIGIARGGLPLLTTIASAFSTREVGVLFIQNTVADEAFSARLPEAVCHGVGIPYQVQDRKVLLVDDIIRSGQSIKQSIKILEELGAKAIKVITLYKQKGEYPFDYYSPVEVKKETWIVFPWDNLS
jgi:hypoxanthine phosphoribosyltransferase